MQMSCQSGGKNVDAETSSSCLLEPSLPYRPIQCTFPSQTERNATFSSPAVRRLHRLNLRYNRFNLLAFQKTHLPQNWKRRTKGPNENKPHRVLLGCVRFSDFKPLPQLRAVEMNQRFRFAILYFLCFRKQCREDVM